MFGPRRQFNLFSLLIGILSIILALVIIQNPLGSLISIIDMVGIILILDGISKWSDIKAIRTYNRTWLYIGAGYDIAIGILMFWMPVFGAVLIWFLLAGFFIYNAGLELWLNNHAFPDRGGAYWVNAAFAVIGLLIGVLLLFKPYLALTFALFWVGFFFMAYGVIKVIRSL